MHIQNKEIYTKLFFIFLLINLLGYFTNCNDDDRIIAYIKNKPLTKGEFFEQLKYLYPKKFDIRISTLRDFFDSKRKLKSHLDSFLEDFVLYEEAKNTDFEKSSYYKNNINDKLKKAEFDLVGYLTFKIKILDVYSVDDQQVNLIKYLGTLNQKYKKEIEDKDLSEEELKMYLLGREGETLKLKENKDYDNFFKAMRRELLISLFKEYKKNGIKEKLVSQGDNEFFNYYNKNREKEFKYLKADKYDRSKKTETYLTYAEVRNDIIDKFVDKDFKKYIKELYKKYNVRYNKEYFYDYDLDEEE